MPKRFVQSVKTFYLSRGSNRMFSYTYTVNYIIKKPKSAQCIPHIVSLKFSKPLKEGGDEFKKMLMLLSKAHGINQAMIGIEGWLLQKRSLNLPKLNLTGRLKSMLALFSR